MSRPGLSSYGSSGPLSSDRGWTPAAVDQHDRVRWADVSPLFADRLARRTRDEWAEHFEETDACVTPVLTMPEAIRHQSHASRSADVEFERMVHPSAVPRFLHRPPSRFTPCVAPVGFSCGMNSGSSGRNAAGRWKCGGHSGQGTSPTAALCDPERRKIKA